jgi:pyruvate dehydrogenase complex dehydrogenase (E1) component
MSFPTVFNPAAKDPDPAETRDWLDSLSAVLQHGGSERASYLLAQLNARARRAGGVIDFTSRSAYATSSAGMQWRWSSAPTASPES